MPSRTDFLIAGMNTLHQAIWLFGLTESSGHGPMVLAEIQDVLVRAIIPMYHHDGCLRSHGQRETSAASSAQALQDFGGSTVPAGNRSVHRAVVTRNVGGFAGKEETVCQGRGKSSLGPISSDFPITIGAS